MEPNLHSQETNRNCKIQYVFKELYKRKARLAVVGKADERHIDVNDSQIVTSVSDRDVKSVRRMAFWAFMFHGSAVPPLPLLSGLCCWEVF